MGFMNGLMGNAEKLDAARVFEEYGRLLAADENVIAGYSLVRDAFVFTDRRIILVDKQGMTGKKTEYHTIPYRSITHFSVETAGSFDLDAELKIWLSGMAAPIEKQFSKGVDIYEVQALMAHHVARA
jgi:hypothetical protein